MSLVNKKFSFRLLENGHDLSQRDELGFSPLHLAALLGRNEIISEMIRIRDEDINTEVGFYDMFLQKFH